MKNLIFLDRLALVMMALVGFVGLSVASFSSRYLRGDRAQRRFYLHLTALILSVYLLVSADHLLLFLAAWAASNLLLVRLMLHKPEWRAARESSRLALKNFALGLLFLGGAFSMLYKASGETSIQAIVSGGIEKNSLLFGALLIFLSAMTQSALWPFHLWLTSSLNSPTPVSAIMHAGLVNGGGFLLARFAPLFLKQPLLLNAVFFMGVLTALVGTLWKLMQNDIKRMLACSTMGQMGFMMAQCGLGLFPAAIAHLCWHGLFKAYLFLSSGSAAQEKRLDLASPPRIGRFLSALACGACAAALFSWVSGKEPFKLDADLFLTALALVAGTQAALSILEGGGRAVAALALALTALLGCLYGASLRLLEAALSTLSMAGPRPLNALHLAALLALIASWLALLFGRGFERLNNPPDWMLNFYVKMLNASQPHPKTVTAHRNEYQF